jgi:hypothetical protein
MPNKRLEFDNQIPTRVRLARVAAPGIIVRYAMKLPWVTNTTQATYVLITIICVCVLLTLYSLVVSAPDSYDIPREAFQDQILNE